MIIEPKDVILYYLNHNFEQADRDQIRFYSPPYKEDTLHVAFSKKTDDYQTLISKFNRGLQLIKSDGTYDNIIMKHGMNSD